MKKQIDKVTVIKIPGGKVTIGPGTVPISEQSVKETMIKKMVAELRKVSKIGIFKEEDKNPYGSSKAY